MLDESDDDAILVDDNAHGENNGLIANGQAAASQIATERLPLEIDESFSMQYSYVTDVSSGIIFIDSKQFINFVYAGRKCPLLLPE